MGGEVLVGRIEPRLVPVGVQHADLGVVRYNLARHAANEAQRSDVRANPVRQGLCRGRLGVGVAGGAQHRDEDLRRPHLPGRPINHVDRLSGIVDKQPLAGRMDLPHRRRQSAFPIPIELAEPGVAVGLRVLGAAFLPEQH